MATMSKRRVVHIGAIGAALTMASCGGLTSDERTKAQNDLFHAQDDIASFCISGGPTGSRGVRTLTALYRQYGGDVKINGQKLKAIVDDEISDLESCSPSYARRLERVRGE
jgi:hypothetical protein